MKNFLVAQNSFFYSKKNFRPRRTPTRRNFGQNDSEIWRFWPKTANFGVILAEISASGCPEWPKIFFRVKKIILCHQKIFQGAEPIFGLHRPEKVQKKVDFWPKPTNLENQCGRNFGVWVSGAAENFFWCKISYFVLPKKFSWCWHYFFDLDPNW